MAQYFIKIKESFLLSDIKDKDILKEFPKFKKPIVDRFKEFTYDTFNIDIYADTDSISQNGPNKGKIIPSCIIYEFGPKQKTSKGVIVAISSKEKDIEVIIDGVFKFSVKSHHEERVQNNKFITFGGIKAFGTNSYLEGEVISGTLEKPSNEIKKKYSFPGNENAKCLLSNYKISLSKDDLK
jgi:hypothetical protein